MCRIFVVTGPRPPAGVDGLVVADRGGLVGLVVLAVALVAEKQCGVVDYGRRRVRPGARCFCDQLVDDIREATAAAQRAALTSRRCAADQHLPGQLGDHLPVPRRLQLWTQRAHEFREDVAGGPADRTVDVDQLALQTGSGRPPQSGPAQRRRHLDGGDARPEPLHLALDQCPEQPGDQHDGVHRGAAVAHPQFQRGCGDGRTDVEVHHPGVRDRSACHQLGHEFVVFGG